MSTKEILLQQYLQHIITANPYSLQAAVATEALDYSSEIEAFFDDLLTYGCQSGMIGSLIYYCDTHAFYDAHYDEIEALRLELEESLGESLCPQGDLKNWFAWMAFEETARMIAEKIGIVI